MQLAHDLHMTRNKLLLEIDSREITDQLAYYTIRNKQRQKEEKKEPEITLQDKFKNIMGSKIIKKPSSKKVNKK